MVTRLDRLARDLLNILDAVGKTGAAFKSLGDAWADTTTPHGRLMLTVLGGLAEFERELILARNGDGHCVRIAAGADTLTADRLPARCRPAGLPPRVTAVPAPEALQLVSWMLSGLFRSPRGVELPVSAMLPPNGRVSRSLAASVDRASSEESIC